MRLLIFIFLTTLLLSSPSFGQENEEQERSTDLVHSDVPLWGVGDDDVWPQYFTSDDGFGCSNRIAMGDWKVSYGDTDREPQWKRFRNYGVFHCYTMVSHAYDKADLDNVPKSSFFVKIGTTKVRGIAQELWVTQEGGRPGSDYILLSRSPDEELITKFNVLQVICPRGSKRKGPELDILMTSYCAVNTKNDMINLARSMAKLPFYATIAFDSETVDDKEKGE